MIDIGIHNHWALGDGVVLTAVVRDVALQYPKKYRIHVSGNYSGILWRNNPYITSVSRSPKKENKEIRLRYDEGIRLSKLGNKQHFLTWFHTHFKELTGDHVAVSAPKGDIHLSEAEKARRFTSGNYWVVLAGGKLDITTKIWYSHRFQQVVDTLKHYGIRCLQAGSGGKDYVNPALDNCGQMVGQTANERDFFSLIANSDGVICGVTSAMHLAAVFDKPCVVLGGGREEPWWEGYTNDYANFREASGTVKMPHKFLHTLGMLDCGYSNPLRGCWKTQTIPRKALTASQKGSLCVKPCRERDFPTPACLDLIKPEHVVEAVLSYYEKGLISPFPGLKLNPEPFSPLDFIKGSMSPISGPFGRYPLPLFDMTDSSDSEKKAKDVKMLAITQEWVSGPENTAFTVLDNPTLGGKVTICILSWGDNLELLKNCLGSIVNTVPRHRRDIRIALNQPSKAVENFILTLDRADVSKVYLDRTKRRKYPAMREMFNDPAHPITTKYLFWFDDDTEAVDPLWLPKICEMIVLNHPRKVRLFGKKMFHDIAAYQKDGHRPDMWFRTASWWKNNHLKLRGLERVGANGSVIEFVAGYFWAMSAEMITLAGIPDTRLNHNGGDITIGAQIHQAGFKIMNCNQNKELVWCPTKEKGGRRGYSEAFPWADPATRSKHIEGA